MECCVHDDQATGRPEGHRAVDGGALERGDRMPGTGGDLVRRQGQHVTDDVPRQGGVGVRRLDDVHGRRLLEDREAPQQGSGHVAEDVAAAQLCTDGRDASKARRPGRGVPAGRRARRVDVDAPPDPRPPSRADVGSDDRRRVVTGAVDRRERGRRRGTGEDPGRRGTTRQCSPDARGQAPPPLRRCTPPPSTARRSRHRPRPRPRPEPRHRPRPRPERSHPRSGSHRARCDHEQEVRVHRDDAPATPSTSRTQPSSVAEKPTRA